MELKDYNEYEQLFNDDLVVAVRNVLIRIEDGAFVGDFKDSPENNALVDYFNQFSLHKKISEEDFNRLKKSDDEQIH